MREEITVLPDGAAASGVLATGEPAGGVPAGGVAGTGAGVAGAAAGDAAAGGAMAEGVTAADAFRSRVPDLTGLPLDDLDRHGRGRLATAARRVVTAGGDR